jgi:hypothetical protein
VFKKTLGKETLCRQRGSLPSDKNITLDKDILCRVFSFTEDFFCLALDKELFAECPEKIHPAKHLALGKEPNSGSE